MRTEESNAWIHIFIADNSLIEKKNMATKIQDEADADQRCYYKYLF